MQDIKVIDNIQPFNELFYRNCFYNSLFSIINHFNKDILSILSNDVVIYSNCDKNEISKFAIKFVSQRTLEDTLETMGILMTGYKYTPDVLRNIITSISKENPVIAYIDAFYEPFRRDTWQKKHLEHAFLVYGYDQLQEIMNIVEHSHSDNLSYENCTISYTDMKNCYEGFYDNYVNDKQEEGFYDFQFKKIYTNEGEVNYRNIFIDNFKKKELEVFNGLKELEEFCKSFGQVVCEETVLCNMLDTLIGSLNTIINAKNAEMYKISKLFGNTNNFFKLQKECMELWSLIRTVVVKYNITGMYKREKFSSLESKLSAIYDNESLYYKELRLLSNEL